MVIHLYRVNEITVMQIIQKSYNFIGNKLTKKSHMVLHVK